MVQDNSHCYQCTFFARHKPGCIIELDTLAVFFFFSCIRWLSYERCLVAGPITVYLSFSYRPVEDKFRLAEPNKGIIIWACRSRALPINRHSQPLHCQSALDKLKVCVPVHPVVALVLFKQITEFVHVHVMEGIELLGRWLLIPLHWNWPPNWGEGANWRTTHSESVSFLILQYVWCFGGLLLSRCWCVTQLQWSIYRYTVRNLLHCESIYSPTV